MGLGGDSRERGGSGGVDTRRAARLGVIGGVIAVTAVFMAQNNQDVQLDILVFSIETSLWVGMLATLLLGAVLGQAAEVLWRRRKGRDDS